MTMRPEAELLLAAVRSGIGSRRPTPVIAPRENPALDWEYLLRAARQHRLVALLSWYLSSGKTEAVPENVLGHLQEQSQRNARRNLLLSEELRKIVDLLTRRGIRVIPFHAPGLADIAPDHPEFREFHIMELFVRRDDDVFGTKELMRSLGYRPRFPVEFSERAAFLEFQGEYQYAHEDFRVQVYLQWDIVPRYWSRKVDFEQLWSRCVRSPLAGTEIMTVTPEDRLLILCARESAYCWSRLDSIAEIASLITRPHGLDWRRILEQRAVLCSERMLLLGLFLASDLAAVPLPAVVRQRLDADRRVQALARHARTRLLGDAAGGPPPRLAAMRFHLKVMERVRDRIRYGFHRLLTPTETDWRALHLPGSLPGLYYLFRPIRLVGGYGLGLFKPRILGSLGLTAPEVVTRMLDLAEVGPSDVVYDLGCGDGRMPIMAAKRYGARGFGFDIDPDCVAESIGNARMEGVEHLVSFKREDATAVDVSPATVVLLFLPVDANLRLRAKLQAQLRPGARIVSHHWSMGDWAPLKTITVPDGEGVTEIHLWRIDKSEGQEPNTVKH
jgi:hypothetical protein